MGVFRSLTRTWYRLKNLPGKIDPHSIRSIVFLTKMKILIVATYVDRVSCKFITLTWPNISGRQENWGWDVSTVVTRVLTVGGTRYWLYTSSFHHWCCWCHIYIKGIDLETQVQFYGRLDTYRVYDQNTNNSEQFYHVNPQYFFNLSD